MMLRAAVAAVAMGALAAGSYAQTGGRLLVVEKTSQSLGIVDPAAGKQVALVSEGKLPGKDTGHEAAASLDGKFAYVPIYGDSGVGKPGSDGRTMVVIDLSTQKIVKTLDFGDAWAGAAVRPHCAVMGPPVAGHPEGVLYVTSELKNAISAIDPKTLKVLGRFLRGRRSRICWRFRTMGSGDIRRMWDRGRYRCWI
jgi:DNA-binding beta-propeller fold protein YncE